MKHNKLVRDKIPDIIRENGETPVVRTLNAIEFKRELKRKLHEEVGEVLGAKTKREFVDELADVHDVLRALYAAYGLSPTDITKAAGEKRKKRGWFAKKIFLIETN